MKLLCPDAGTNPASRTKDRTRTKWRNLFKTTGQNIVIYKYNKSIYGYAIPFSEGYRQISFLSGIHRTGKKLSFLKVLKLLTSWHFN